MSFQEARESMSEIVRWTVNPKDAEDKSVYLGEILTGYYVGKKTDVGQNSSNLYEIQMSDAGPNLGRKVAVWGSQLLDGRFDEIPQNCMVRITCLGIAQPKTPKGRAYMNFKVEYDKTATRPANMVEATAPGAVATGATLAPAPTTTAPVTPAGYTGPVGDAPAATPTPAGF